VFTGLVADIGVVERIVSQQGGARLTLRPLALEAETFEFGESIACSGACLTVSGRGDGSATFDAVPETLTRTTLGGWRRGTRVNLERALRLGDRLGGHLVAGHVDAVGDVLARVTQGQGTRFTISLPSAIAPLVAEKGSIAVDGVSLTVAAAGRDRFEIAVIPETLSRTTLGEMRPGTRVNLEADIIARHVARLREFTPLGTTDLAGWGYGESQPV
jgi:riboflavin synthase